MKQDCQLFDHVVLVPPECAAGVLTTQLRCSRGRQICCYFASLYLWVLLSSHKPDYIHGIYNRSLSHTVGQGKTNLLVMSAPIQKFRRIYFYLWVSLAVSNKSHHFMQLPGAFAVAESAY